MNKNNKVSEERTIDLSHILKTLLKRVWVLIIAAIIGGSAFFVYSNFFKTPLYSSQILLYVNNSSFSVGSTSVSISASQISAAQSLAKTYTVILNNRTTLEKIIERAGINYSYGQLGKMIEAYSVNETEVLCVKVTCEDPYEASKIANCIAEVLPERISEIIEKSNVVVVDTAIPSLVPVSPNVMTDTVIGVLLGILVAGGLIVLFAILDDSIHDENYIIQNTPYPVLAKIPGIINAEAIKRGHHTRYYRKYYQNYYVDNSANQNR
ncbi:MAG: hypothetical protein IJO00_00380 [Clostridia bacterium]|nr:hypothetical protein [Clostridia bacterium]